MSANMNGSNLDKVVFGKLVSETVYKKASAALTAGDYPVDLLVHITGQVTRGVNYEQEIVEKADPWGLLAMALSKLNGVTVESLTREALGLTEDQVTAVKEQAKEAIEKVKGPTKTPCNGKVTTELTVEVVPNAAVMANNAA